MFISDFAIRRPISTIVTMIALVVFGLASLLRLEPVGVMMLMGIVAKDAILLNDFRVPLGRVVIGGVIASTVLALVVIPTVYEIMEERRSHLLRRSGLGAHGAPPDD